MKSLRATVVMRTPPEARHRVSCGAKLNEDASYCSSCEEPEIKAQAIEEVGSSYNDPTIWGEEFMKTPWGR